MKEFTYTIKEPVGIHARPAGMLANSSHKEEAKLFLGFLRSEEALAVFAKYGFSANK